MRERKDGGGYRGDDMERTVRAYHLDDFNPARADGYYQMPVLKACHFTPDNLIGFNYVKSIVEKGKSDEYVNGVHFFIDDYQFERIWNKPQKNIERLKHFACALTPDFSLYMEMSMALKIWNVYRSRLIGQMMQDAGLKVIPTLRWAEKDTFDFCFDGIEPGGVVAVSNVGMVRDKEMRAVWRAGMDAAIERLRPEAVIAFGYRYDYDFGGIKVKYIKPQRGL